MILYGAGFERFTHFRDQGVTKPESWLPGISTSPLWSCQPFIEIANLESIAFEEGEVAGVNQQVPIRDLDSGDDRGHRSSTLAGPFQSWFRVSTPHSGSMPLSVPPC